MSELVESNMKSVAKSGIITRLAQAQTQLSEEDVELAVSTILEKMIDGLVSGDRVEIRGFGSMSLHYRPPRTGRNPKTGNRVEVAEKFVPHFKPGTELKARVDQSLKK
ncbi:MAG: integration host factor subunit beta [Saprospiraceae bacterium]|jgi:integration host factor subunit beta